MTAIGIRYPLLSIVAAGAVAALPIFGVILIRSSCTQDAPLAADRDHGDLVVGVPMAHVDASSHWYELGLRDGDVITRIDEQNGVVRIDIIRNGQPGTLRHSI
jgi:hypothetical protein